MKLDDLKKELNSDLQSTEKGMLGYSTSGKALLDINYKASSMRNMNKHEIWNLFMQAYYESPILAVKWLFFLRDRDLGMGERRSFRIIMKELAESYPDVIACVIQFVPVFGRWDDLWCLLDCPKKIIKDVVLYLVREQVLVDLKACWCKKSVSLIGKWLPSASSKKEDNRRWASIIRKYLGFSKKQYRDMCSILRKQSDVVEVKMSSKRWDEINYEHIPSRANLIYNGAFLRNDEGRRREYLDSVSKGNSKINAKNLFAYDIVHKYCKEYFWPFDVEPLDQTLEQLWNNLPNVIPDCHSAIVVADTSGSMRTEVGSSRVTAYEVAMSLAFYMSERLSGEFKDTFITFSSKPSLISLANCKTLHDKIEYYNSKALVGNTNIEAVFDLILNIAVKNNYSQSELPSNIIICSDMEFDECQGYYEPKCNKAGFNRIKDKYAEYGYKMPMLTFWNICGETNTVPLQENDLGVHLLSGFNQAIADMAFSQKLDPYECLLEKLNSDRYKEIEEALQSE